MQMVNKCKIKKNPLEFRTQKLKCYNALHFHAFKDLIEDNVCFYEKKDMTTITNKKRKFTYFLLGLKLA